LCDARSLGEAIYGRALDLDQGEHWGWSQNGIRSTQRRIRKSGDERQLQRCLLSRERRRWTRHDGRSPTLSLGIIVGARTVRKQTGARAQFVYEECNEHIKTEKDIFDFFHLEERPPNERCC
jgi:hypothetical protein